MSTNEPLKPSEKIQLATQNICFMVNSLSVIATNFKSMDSLKASAVRHEEFLEKQSKKLIRVMNDLGDYLNNHDAITELDCKILNPVFEILNPGLEKTLSDENNF